MKPIMLRDVPEHWDIKRLGQLFVERKEKVSDKDYPPLSVTKGGIVPQMEHVAKTDDGDNRKKVCIGDFVINSRSDRKGSSGISDYDGSVSLINIVLEPKNGHSGFMHHLLKSVAFQEEFYRFGHGIVADLWTTRYSEMKGIHVALPDIINQKRIADFLERETSRIDQLIEKKKRLVKLLGDRMQSLIEDFINVEGPITKLGHHVRILPGYAFASSEFSNDHEDIRLLRGANVSPGRIRWDDIVYWPRELVSTVNRFVLKSGDVVLGMDRPWISSGIRIAVLSSEDEPCLLLQRVCKIEPMQSLDKGFMKLLLRSKRFLAYFEPILTGISVPHISGDQVEGFQFSYIPYEKQSERAKNCHFHIKQTEDLKTKVETSVNLLLEFRSALITAAVTGQIDVEHWNRRGETERHLDTIEEVST